MLDASDSLDALVQAQLDAVGQRLAAAAAQKQHQYQQHQPVRQPDYAAAVQQITARIAILDAHNARLAQQCVEYASSRPQLRPRQYERPLAYEKMSDPFVPAAAAAAATSAPPPPSVARQSSQSGHEYGRHLSPRSLPRRREEAARAAADAANTERTRQQLEQVLGMHGELMATVKQAAADDAERRAASEEADRRWREQIAAAARQPRRAEDDDYNPLDVEPRRADPSSASPWRGRGRPKSESEEKLLDDLRGALDGVSDDEEAAVVEAADAAAAPSAAEAAARPAVGCITLKSAALAILFALKLRARASSALLSEDDGRALLEVLSSRAVSWLRLPLRPVVQSILSDASLHLDFGSGGLAGAGNAVGNAARGLRFWQKKETSAAAGERHEQQARKLKVRMRSLLEALMGAVPDAPAPLLHSLHCLCHRRMHWPSEFGLYASERATLLRQSDGSDLPSADAPARLALGLILTRVAVQQLLLRPKENAVASKPSSRALANLKVLAAMLHYLCHAALATSDPGAVSGAALQASIDASLEGDAEAVQPFASELRQLRQHGLPLLEEWVAQNRAMLRMWSLAMLRAAAVEQERRKDILGGGKK